MSENLSKFEVGETIIVKRGSKAILAGTEVKVLARDSESGKYAVITEDNKVFTLAAERLGRKPERTFTESEIIAALNQYAADAAVRDVATLLDLGGKISYPIN